MQLGGTRRHLSKRPWQPGLQTNAQVIFLCKTLAHRRSSVNLYSGINWRSSWVLLMRRGSMLAPWRTTKAKLICGRHLSVCKKLWSYNLSQPLLQTLVCGPVSGGWGDASCHSVKGRVVRRCSFSHSFLERSVICTAWESRPSWVGSKEAASS